MCVIGSAQTPHRRDVVSMHKDFSDCLAWYIRSAWRDDCLQGVTNGRLNVKVYRSSVSASHTTPEGRGLPR